MKKIKIILLVFVVGLFIVFTNNCKAQAPQKFSYQAVASDSLGNVYANHNVNFRLSVRNGSPTGTVEYSELQLATTNQFGLVNLLIGSGAVVNGNFVNITWGNGQKYLQVEMDLNGGSSFTTYGTPQLLSVPYAIYAKTAETLASNEVFYKLTNSVTTSSTTATDVTNMNFNIGANEVWTFEFNMFCKGAPSNGLRWALTFPNGANLNASIIGSDYNSQTNALGGTLSASGQLSYYYGGQSFNTLDYSKISGIITNGSTAGTVQLQFATLNSGTSIVYSTSYLSAKKH